jgi:hypothetical protein
VCAIFRKTAYVFSYFPEVCGNSGFITTYQSYLTTIFSHLLTGHGHQTGNITAPKFLVLVRNTNTQDTTNKITSDTHRGQVHTVFTVNAKLKKINTCISIFNFKA